MHLSLDREMGSESAFAVQATILSCSERREHWFQFFFFFFFFFGSLFQVNVIDLGANLRTLSSSFCHAGHKKRGIYLLIYWELNPNRPKSHLGAFPLSYKSTFMPVTLSSESW